MNELSLLTASGSSAEPLYSSDVFSAYTYTGNGGSQIITNGIDLAGKGGLVWTKSRTSTANHALIDTVRGTDKLLNSAGTEAQTADAVNALTNLYSTGYRVANGDFGTSLNNISGVNYVSYTFRRSPKFFDCGTYTGNGVAGRQISHALGVAPGMIFIKCSSISANWVVYSNALGGTKALRLNDTSSQLISSMFFNNSDATSSTFTLGTEGDVNGNGFTYVWYAVAHDPSADGIIQCGSFTTDSSGNATVNLGWEPQFLVTKCSSATDGWWMQDSMRGLTANNAASNTQLLQANLSNAEEAATGPYVSASGFYGKNLGASRTFIYLAIRRPNKPPTTGTQVYNAIARTGTGAAATVTGVGFAPDLVMFNTRNTSSHNKAFNDRLRGTSVFVCPNRTDGDITDSTHVTAFGIDGISLGADSTGYGAHNVSGNTYINHFFKRAPGVFETICYTGTGSATTVAHSLGVAPELMIFKSRNDSTRTTWNVWHSLTATTACRSSLYQTAAQAGPVTYATFGNFTGPPTATGIPLSTVEENYSGNTNVAYLFATKAGISKVGSYTGNGSSQTINCGFTTGARFVLIKRTDSTGDWYVWDSVRGIVAGNDPHLSLNTTAAEVTTDDSIDPDASGFIVNQLASTNINVNAATYIYLAIS